MNRTRWLIFTVLGLLVANAAYHWWRARGLITIHCDDWAPSKVVKEIERQGGVILKTNLPEDLKIHMNVTKVPVGEALETLATVAEARWRLAYVFAPTLPEAHAALASFVNGQKPDGWKQLYFPLFMPITTDDAGGPEPDPRTDRWLVKSAEKPEFQSYVKQAAQSVSAAFAFPEKWNPPVKKAPSTGTIENAAPALAKAAGGRVLEVFMVEKRSRDSGDGGRDRGGPPDGDFGDRVGFSRGRDQKDGERDIRRDAYAQRAQAEIDKLPPDKRKAAQAEFDERRKFFESLASLPQEERRAKMEERMNNPATQDRMDQRMSDQNARMSPDQRVSKANRYVQRKESVRNPTGGQ